MKNFRWSTAFNDLLAEGFAATDAYCDGCIRFERPLANGDTLYTFLKPDGSHRVPRVWEAELDRIFAENAAAQA